MNKRILAMLLSILLVLSAFFMSACDTKKSGSEDDDDGSSTSEISKIDVENATPEDVIKQSITNLVAGVMPESIFDAIDIPTAEDFTNQLSDFTISAKAEINKLVIEGEDPFKGKTVKANAEAIFDADNYALEANLGLEYMGEKPKASAIINSDGVYITEALGVLDKSIYVELPIGEYIDEIKAGMEEYAISQEDAEKIADAIVSAMEALEKAIDNIPDDAYAAETKTLTVDSVEFKDARVVTLTLTPEIMKTFATDVVTDLLENETIKEYLGTLVFGTEEIDIEEIKADLESELEDMDLPTIKVVSTVSTEGDVVAFDVIATMEGEDNEFKVQILTVGDNFKLYFGMTENGEFTDDYVAIEYTYDKASKAEKLVIGMADQSERVDYLVAEGTFDGNKHEGTLSIGQDVPESTDGAMIAAMNFSLKYVLETTDNSFSLNVKDVSTKVDGATVTFPVDATIYAKASDTEVTLGAEFKLDMEGTIEIDASAEISFKVGDVTVKAPSSYTSVEDMTDDDLINMLGEVTENFPNIYSFVEELMNSYTTGNGPSYGDEYYGDEYYGDEYYGDEYYGDYEDGFYYDDGFGF